MYAIDVYISGGWKKVITEGLGLSALDAAYDSLFLSGRQCNVSQRDQTRMNEKNVVKVKIRLRDLKTEQGLEFKHVLKKK